MSKKSDHWAQLVVILTTVMIIIFIVVAVRGALECDGKYVRGLFWFECIEVVTE